MWIPGGSQKGPITLSLLVCTGIHSFACTDVFLELNYKFFLNLGIVLGNSYKTVHDVLRKFIAPKNGPKKSHVIQKLKH